MRSFRMDGATHSIATIYPFDFLSIPSDVLLISFNAF